MRTLLVKKFPFSASFERAGRHFGHNYVLTVEAEPAAGVGEEEITARVDRTLIRKMESRDLGLHVDFLKNTELSDANLLGTFWKILEDELKPAVITRLGLQKDARTETTLSR